MWQILSPSYVGDLEQGIPDLRMTPTDRIRQSPNSSVKNFHKALLFFLLQVLFHGIHLKSLDSVDYFVFSAKKLGTQKQSSFLLIMFNQYAQILDKLGYCIFLVSPFVTRLFWRNFVIKFMHFSAIFWAKKLTFCFSYVWLLVHWQSWLSRRRRLQISSWIR